MLLKLNVLAICLCLIALSQGVCNNFLQLSVDVKSNVSRMLVLILAHFELTKGIKVQVNSGVLRRV